MADWRRELAEAYVDPKRLLRDLGLPESLASSAAAAAFGLRVPRGFAAKMRRADPHDPLLKQVLPIARETLATPGYVADPVGDLAAVKAPGLLHKYAYRVLLNTTSACGVHCRYCFRRAFPYAEVGHGHRSLLSGERAALAYLNRHTDIQEVILSGGDPLSLSDARLRALLTALDAVPHLQRLRIHSRMPVVLPSRLTPGLAQLLARSRCKVVLVIHANHANECCAALQQGLRTLQAAGVTLLNQAVLLRGVNDDVASLVKLSERLMAMGVLPYYLHVLDKVSGAAHFDVDDATARALHDALKARLPGYLVPRLAREQPGADSKSWL